MLTLRQSTPKEERLTWAHSCRDSVHGHLTWFSYLSCCWFTIPHIHNLYKEEETDCGPQLPKFQPVAGWLECRKGTTLKGLVTEQSRSCHGSQEAAGKGRSQGPGPISKQCTQLLNSQVGESSEEYTPHDPTTLQKLCL